MKASKFVYNDNDWTSVSGLAQTGIIVNRNEQNKKKYYFGLEEWNNSNILRNHKLAYLDSFRSHSRPAMYDHVNLFMFSPLEKVIYHVGFMTGVKQLSNNQIPEIRAQLDANNWLNTIEPSFHAINDQRSIIENREYMQSWDSDSIVEKTNDAFILNVTYDSWTIFPIPINLTRIDPNVNSRWRRLSVLYNVNNQL